MKKNYENKVKAMIDNYLALKNAFKWESDYVSHLLALSFAMEKKTLDVTLIRENKKHIKSVTGAFSPFRGNMAYCLAGLLASKEKDVNLSMTRMIDNAKAAKGYGFKQQTFIPTAIYTLESMVDMSPESILSKAQGIYKDMKANHPFLTSGDDYALAILLANSEHNTEKLELYYKGLSQVGFSKANGLQMLSQIMALGGMEVDAGCQRCKNILDYLKANGYKVYVDYYPAVGLLSLLEEDTILKDLLEVLNYLKKQKKYKWLGKGMILLLASAIISSEWVDNFEDEMIQTALSVSIENIIIAQQVAMIAAVSAATAASAAT